MGLFDGLRDKIVGFMQGVINDAYTKRADDIVSRRSYRYGVQRRQLKVGNFDDNLIMNFTGLAVDRSVSMLFGKEVEFEFEKGEGPDEQEVEESPQETLIHETWEANKKPILLHDLAEDGAVSGDCYIKIIPDGVVHNGKMYSRLVVLDPAFMDLTTAPDDMDRIVRYIIQYLAYDDNGREIAKRETTEWMQTSDTDPDTGYWLITHAISRNGRWEDDLSIPPVSWEWDFAPIVHWKNLPFPHNVYGMPDVTPDVREVQDRKNFVDSNISKINRLYAHPQRWSKFFSKAPGEVSMGPEDMPNANNPNAEINQLAPQGDLVSSRAFSLDLRQSIFDLTRTVDITSITDKLGSLTNFGLRVLYQDALAKLETKRALYGWGLEEINRRITIIANMEPLECEVIWKNPLPENIVEQSQVYTAQLADGVVDKQTISERSGYDWTKVQARLEEEKAQGADLGTTLLNAFNKGQ